MSTVLLVHGAVHKSPAAIYRPVEKAFDDRLEQRHPTVEKEHSCYLKWQLGERRCDAPSVLPLVITSNNAGDRLVIDPGRPDYWTATLECTELQARHSFYEIHIDSLPHFLSGLASSWRGWEGERIWKSLESDVELKATHDGRGSVALVATLRDDIFDARSERGWMAQALLTLDAGTALDQLAREAALHLR